MRHKRMPCGDLCTIGKDNRRAKGKSQACSHKSRAAGIEQKTRAVVAAHCRPHMNRKEGVSEVIIHDDPAVYNAVVDRYVSIVAHR